MLATGFCDACESGSYRLISLSELTALAVTSVFIPGLPFPGRPGFPAVLIPGFPGIKTPSFPGKTGTSKRQFFIK